jgi:hypothetical protein
MPLRKHRHKGVNMKLIKDFLWYIKERPCDMSLLSSLKLAYDHALLMRDNPNLYMVKTELGFWTLESKVWHIVK